jgi:hypothetical protein
MEREVAIAITSSRKEQRLDITSSIPAGTVAAP